MKLWLRDAIATPKTNNHHQCSWQSTDWAAFHYQWCFCWKGVGFPQISIFVKRVCHNRLKYSTPKLCLWCHSKPVNNSIRRSSIIHHLAPISEPLTNAWCAWHLILEGSTLTAIMMQKWSSWRVFYEEHGKVGFLLWKCLKIVETTEWHTKRSNSFCFKIFINSHTIFKSDVERVN